MTVDLFGFYFWMFVIMQFLATLKYEIISLPHKMVSGTITWRHTFWFVRGINILYSSVQVSEDVGHLFFMLLFIFDSNYLCLLLLAINNVIAIIWCKPCIVSVPDKFISHCWYLTSQFWLRFDPWKIYILYHGAMKINLVFCSVKFWKDNQKQHTLLNIPASTPKIK